MTVLDLLTRDDSYEFWSNARSIFHKNGYSVQIINVWRGFTEYQVAVTYNLRILTDRKI